MSEKPRHRPRILVIGPSAPPHNGMSIATESVLHALTLGYEVVHLDTADRRPLAHVGHLDPENIRLALAHAIRFVVLLARHRPDIVYLPVAQAPLGFLRDACFLVPCHLLARRTVVHLHGGHFARFFARSNPLLRGLIRFCLKKVDRVIVLGESLRNLFAGIVPPDRVRVIPNGVPDFCGDGIRRSPPGREPRVLFLSTLIESKGFLDVLRAIPAILRRHPAARFVFVGEWCSRESERQARALIAEEHLDACVAFPGAQGPPEKYNFFLDADIFVLPSYNEGQPFAILEAMCAALPVLTTAAGCIPETVLDGLNGFILPSHDPEALSTTICRLLENESLHCRMAEASRARFEELYTLERFSVRMQRLFTELRLPMPFSREPRPDDDQSVRRAEARP